MANSRNARGANRRAASAERTAELRSARRRAVAAKTCLATLGAVTFGAAMVFAQHSYAGHAKEPATALEAPRCGHGSVVNAHGFDAMGCEIAVGGASPRARRAIEALFHERELIFSRFIADSELNRVNAGAGRFVLVSPLFAETLRIALRAAPVAPCHPLGTPGRRNFPAKRITFEMGRKRSGN